MTDWYTFAPQDTLYFRGAEPSNMGESHTASMIFPPPAHTIAGALRTAVLVQNKISLNDYNDGNNLSDRTSIIDAIGTSGEDSPFGILGPLFLRGEKVWVPCPFIWFSEVTSTDDSQIRLRKISTSAPLNNGSLVKTENGKRLFWVKGEDLETLGGDWVSIEDLCATGGKKNVLGNKHFFTSETHTGIALDGKTTRRMVREGHLYSFVHARLCEGVKLIFGVTRKLPLKESGVLKLGAEQRFGEYKKVDAPAMSQGASGLFMTLSIQAGTEEANRHCIATGRIRYLGGWDLHRGFHKPMRGFYPAGSVFEKKISENCIEL